MPVSITIGPDGRIWADIPYKGGKGPKYAKRVPGCRPKFKRMPEGQKDKFLAWTYPLDLISCRGLRRVFGKSLRIATVLADWARKQIEYEEFMADLAACDDSPDFTLADIAPSLDIALSSRPFQRVGAHFITEGRRVLLADQPGLGKTIMTLAALMHDAVSLILIVAPRTAHEAVWKREIERWTWAKAFVASGTPTQRRRAIEAATAPAESDEDVRFLICNAEMVRVKRIVSCPDDCGGDDECEWVDEHSNVYSQTYSEMFAPTFDAIVVDECHRGVIGKNTMSKSVSQTRLGMMRLSLADNGIKIALSGTPYRGKPELLWGILNWLRPDVFTSFWRWVETFFVVDIDHFGTRTIGEMREDMEEEYDRQLVPFLLRRTKAEVARDLPPKMYGGTPLDADDPTSPVAVWLEMEPEQAKLYGQMRTESFVQIGEGTINAIGVLSMMTRLKQFAICSWNITDAIKTDGTIIIDAKPEPSNKYKWLLMKMQEWEDNGTKVVVASQYTKVINAFAAQLDSDGYPNYVLTGETKQDERGRIIEDFQNNPDSPAIFLINTNAGGVAITLDAADDLVFLDETYIPDDQEQVEDRCHRVSRIHQVTIWKLMSLSTIEESIARTNEYREGKIKARLDGSRGVDFAKKLLGG